MSRRDRDLKRARSEPGPAAEDPAVPEIDLGRRKLTIREKELIARVYPLVRDARANPGAWSRKSTAEIVGEFFDVSPREVANVQHEAKETDGHFEVGGVNGGGPAAKIAARDGVPVVRRIMARLRQAKLACTARLVTDRFQLELGIKVSTRTVRSYLRRWGFQWRRSSSRRNVLADSAAVHKLRLQYLRFYLESIVNKTLVCTDESFVHLNPTTAFQWRDPSNDYGDPALGPRYNIVAAIAYPQQCDGHELHAPEWVPGSFVCWSSQGGPQPAAREAARKHLKEPEPFKVKINPATGDEADYHGSMDVNFYMAWFRQLCDTCRKRYGPCLIKLDGAKYHRSRTAEMPTTTWLKQRLLDFLTAHHVAHNPSYTKPELLPLAKAWAHDHIAFCVAEVAHEFGHTVIFTPPYHPELNEIEKVWATMKQWLRCNPSMSMTELYSNIIRAKQEVKVSTFKGAQRVVDGQHTAYWDLAENEAADSDVSDGEEVDIDDVLTDDEDS